MDHAGEVSCWRSELVRFPFDELHTTDEFASALTSSPYYPSPTPDQIRDSVQQAAAAQQYVPADAPGAADTNRSAEVAKAYAKVHEYLASGHARGGPPFIFPPAFHSRGNSMFERASNYISTLHAWRDLVAYLRRIFPGG